MSTRFVVALAVALRVVWVLAIPTRPVGDFAMYLESAAHLLSHRALDGEFVFMPGYVGFAAGVMALGGGQLAIKLCVAVAAGLAAGAITGIGAALWDRRCGVAAGLVYALWPAGVAVTSVTGTDMPAAILVVTAVFVLIRWGSTRPRLGAVAFGLVMGLAATVRAVAVPLAAFSFFFFVTTARAAIEPPARRAWLAARHAALATAVALLVLAPWVVRNHQRYGEWFLTDSHGGLTALVGANPNTDGRYSRSLNRMFTALTGHVLLAEPHRAADRASYRLAQDWTRFAPAYAAGLVVLKGERLLRDQRPLLYWPVYRAGVLPAGALAAWFDRWRAVIEAVVWLWWVGFAAAFFAGVGVAVARRRWDALWFVPIGVALVGIYALFFAEVRYQLPIVMLMFPLAGGALVFARDVAVHLRRTWRLPRGLQRELLFATAAVVLAAGALAGLSVAGERWRTRHRFAVHVCDVAGSQTACKWRMVQPLGAVRSTPSPLRGVWDGVGVRLTDAASEGPSALSVQTELALAKGRYRVRAAWDVAPVDDEPAAAGTVTLRANDDVVADTTLAALVAAGRQGVALPVAGDVVHAGGPLRLRLTVDVTGAGDASGRGAGAAVWLTTLSIVAADGSPP